MKIFGNSLKKHGPIKLSKNKKYLIHQDTTPFFYLADTWWYGVTKRAKWPYPFKDLVQDRKKKGFSVIQLVIGVPPETEMFSENAKNSGGWVFKKDWSINQKYFEEADKKITYLVEQGLVPCIVGGWGFHIDIAGVENIKKLWQEIIKRYSRLPVIFCLCGEVDGFLLPIEQKMNTQSSDSKNIKKVFKFLPGRVFLLLRKIKNKILQKVMIGYFGYLRKKRLERWECIAEYIKSIDKYNRPLFVHTTPRFLAGELFGHPKWLDIDSIQSGHEKDNINFMVNSILKASAKRMIIDLEPWYEGLRDVFDDSDIRYAFWACILSGAKGHAYGAHGLWQMSKKGENYLGHWGASDWKKALRFQGAVQLGKAAKLLKKYEWWKIKPSFKKTIPCWNKNNLNYPFCGEIDDNICFIYIPRQSNLQKVTIKKLKRNSTYLIKYLDTKDLKTKREFLIQDNLSFDVRLESIDEDLLVIVFKQSFKR